MKNTKKELQNSLGMSLIEIVIGLAVMSVISLGIGTTMLQMTKTGKRIENKADENDILSSFADYLKTEDFCQAALIGKKVTKKGLEIKAENFDGAGVKTGLTDDKALAAVSNLRVDSLRAILNENVTAVPTLFEGLSANERMIDIVLKTSRRELRGEKKEWLENAKRRYSLPVKMRGGKVLSCNHQMSPESACTAAGGAWDKNKSSCESTAKCESKGTYITWRCDNVKVAEHIKYCGKSIKETIGAVSSRVKKNKRRGTKVGSKQWLIADGGYKNAFNGKLSCPSGSTAIITGMDSIYHEGLDCGKKCTYSAAQIAYFYSCLKCSSN